MKKSAAKLTLACIQNTAIRMIAVYVMMAIMIVIIIFKGGESADYVRSDRPAAKSAEACVTVGKDGTAQIEESIVRTDGGAPEKSSRSSLALVNTLRDGSLTFSYRFGWDIAADSASVKIVLEGADLSKAACWSQASGFHGAAGFRDGAYVAFTTGDLGESEYIRVELLLSPEYFTALNPKLEPYYEEAEYFVSTERERFTRGGINTASSLTMHYIRLADRVLLFALLAALILMFTLPFKSKEPDELPKDDDGRAKEKYVAGMRRYTLLILCCELALTVSVVLNPFELRLKWFAITVMLLVCVGATLLLGTAFALSLMKQAKIEFKSPRSVDGSVPDLISLSNLPVKSAGRKIIMETNAVPVRGGTRTVYTVKCFEEYLSLYKCPCCGRINLQKLTSRMEANDGSERKAARKLGKYVPSVSEALMGGKQSGLLLCLRANISTRCLFCQKTPYWAVKNENKDKVIFLFVGWFMLAAATVAIAKALGLKDLEPLLLLAGLMVLPALPLTEPLIILKHCVKKLLSKFPTPRLFAGDLRELDARKTEITEFCELKLKTKPEDYGEKWEKSSDGCGGTILDV